jgi:RNA polymerase sigma-70 factor (ECF subfamily)
MPGEVEALIFSERTRVVRFCAAFTGNPEAAEDLAQETLLEVWRHKDELREQGAYISWLLGIARNVCLRWRRRLGREPVPAVELYRHSEAQGDSNLDVADEEFDLELELEQRELADLLDRAMAFLPPHVRAVLVERYVMDSPLSEVAERMGLSEGAVAMRVQRGKLALKRILSTELNHEAASFGLVDLADANRRETNMWCPICSERRLIAQRLPETHEFVMWCPACYDRTGQYNWACGEDPRNYVLEGITSYKSVLNRFFNWYRQTYQPGLDTGHLTCEYCGRKIRMHRTMPDQAGAEMQQLTGFHTFCEGCGSSGWATCASLMRSLPEVQRFWREHPRMRTLPVREIEMAGSPALAVSFESVKSHARLDVVAALDNLRVIKIYEVRGE